MVLVKNRTVSQSRWRRLRDTGAHLALVWACGKRLSNKDASNSSPRILKRPKVERHCSYIYIYICIHIIYIYIYIHIDDLHCHNALGLVQRVLQDLHPQR